MIDDLAGPRPHVQALGNITVSWRNSQGGAMVAMAGVTLIYAAAAMVGLQGAVVGRSITLIWAPSGIALAALLLLGARMAPAVALGAFLANAWTGVPLAVAAGITVGNTCEALLGLWLLTRLTDFHRMLDRQRDVLAMIALAAVASTAASAAIGVFTLTAGALMPLQDWAGAWVKWWLGDMMGVLVVAPAVLVWLGPKPPPVSSARALEATLLAATLVGASWLLFGGPEIAGRGYYPAALVVFPFVTWGALRFGQRGATLVTLAVSGLAVWGTMRGTGPFVVEGAVDSLVRWCTFAIIGAVTGLLLAASVDEQRRAQAELLRSYAELERQVSERTRALQETNARLLREMSERRELENELLGVSEAQQRAIGRELHDGLGQHLTSLALLGAALHQRLDDRGGIELEAVTRIVALANQANTMTQTLARGLFPVAFEFGGLPAALEKLGEQTRALSRMDCRVRCDARITLPGYAEELNLYRIAQEAVNNALKHGNAGLIEIELARIDTVNRLTISDDGIGIELCGSGPTHQPGLGLRSMRHRAQLLGGTLTIEPAYPRGTRIVVTVVEAGSHA